MTRRLNLSLKRINAMEVTRVAISDQKLVYILTANRSFQYSYGRSSVAYIGTTEQGVWRVARSAAERADKILRKHGVSKVSARIVTCSPRQRVKTWKKLERALLLAFREKYGDVPTCNTHGKKIQESDEYEYFAREAVRKIIENLG